MDNKYAERLRKSRERYHAKRAQGYPSRSKRKTYDQNKKYALRYRAKLKHDIPKFLQISMKTIRYRAKKSGLPCNIDLEWLQMQRMQCAITGVPFVIPPVGTGPLTPSFDQRIPGAGYTKENTQLICLWLNIAKRDWPEDQIRALIREAGKVV